VRVQWKRTLATVAVALVAHLSFDAGTAGARSTSGNGEASKDVATIVADAEAATASASTVRISGTIDEDGNRTSLNIVSSDGSGAGVMFQAGKRFQLVVHPPDLYLKAPASTWRALSEGQGEDASTVNAVAQLFGGKWVRMSTANEEFGSLAKLFDISTFNDDSDDLSSVRKLPVTTFHGARAIPLHNDAKQSTVYVAATGKPYVLGVTSNGTSAGSIVFSEYDTAKVPPAPKHSIDLSSFQQSAG